ncbi:MAG: hypothetical protein ACKVU4_00620 [Phycisphaerales bacterium]
MAQNPVGTPRPADAPVARAGSVKPMSNAPKTFADLPYFKDYLREVLRPRVEAMLKSVDANLTETVWRVLLASLAREQGEPAIDPAILRSMIEEHLGLRLEARLQAEFTRAAEAAPTAPPSPSAGGGGEPAEPPDVTLARRRPMTTNPLAQAVMDNRAARF